MGRARCATATSRPRRPARSSISASPNGASAATGTFVGYNGSAVEVGSTINLTSNIDSGLLSNYYGENPGNQGKNSLYCATIENPSYGVKGGYRPNVKEFVVVPATSRITSESGTLAEKLALDIVLVPALTDADDRPTAAVPPGAAAPRRRPERDAAGSFGIVAGVRGLAAPPPGGAPMKAGALIAGALVALAGCTGLIGEEGGTAARASSGSRRACAPMLRSACASCHEGAGQGPRSSARPARTTTTSRLMRTRGSSATSIPRRRCCSPRAATPARRGGLPTSSRRSPRGSIRVPRASASSGVRSTCWPSGPAV